MPETEGTIWFVDAEENDNRVTFGFNAEGEMSWFALGALHENGWTCGLKVNWPGGLEMIFDPESAGLRPENPWVEPNFVV